MTQIPNQKVIKMLEFKSWMKTRTLIYCERHGWVAGKFMKLGYGGREVPSGYAKFCRGKKYVIDYCCKTKCTDEEPESIYDKVQSSEQTETEVED